MNRFGQKYAQQVKQGIATAFVADLSTKDWKLLRGVLAPDVTWTLPGDNQISGPADGAQAVLDRAALISEIDTYLSDVEGMNAFFAELPA